MAGEIVPLQDPGQGRRGDSGSEASPWLLGGGWVGADRRGCPPLRSRDGSTPAHELFAPEWLGGGGANMTEPKCKLVGNPGGRGTCEMTPQGCHPPDPSGGTSAGQKAQLRQQINDQEIKKREGEWTFRLKESAGPFREP